MFCGEFSGWGCGSCGVSDASLDFWGITSWPWVGTEDQSRLANPYWASNPRATNIEDLDVVLANPGSTGTLPAENAALRMPQKLLSLPGNYRPATDAGHELPGTHGVMVTADKLGGWIKSLDGTEIKVNFGLVQKIPAYNAYFALAAYDGEQQACVTMLHAPALVFSFDFAMRPGSGLAGAPISSHGSQMTRYTPASGRVSNGGAAFITEYVPNPSDPNDFPPYYRDPNQFGRSSMSMGRDYSVWSTYDDSPGGGWSVHRHKYDESGSSLAISDHAGPASGASGDNWVVRGSSRVDVNDGEPWVICKNGDTWKTGQWLNSDKKDPTEPNDPTALCRITEAEVERTIGTLPEGARLMCYTHRGGRDLAIWFERDTDDLAADGSCTNPDADSIRRYVFWMYDSDAGPDPFIYYEFKFCYEAAEYDPAPDTCQAPGVVVDAANWPYTPTPFFEGSRGPTYITTDAAGDVWIGSPWFVRKIGPVAKARNAAFAWEELAADYYPTQQVTLTGPCGGGTATRPLPFSGRYGTTPSEGYWFGHLDHRDFAILPVRGGVQLRGFQGTIEWATNQPAFSGVTYYPPPTTSGAQKSQWITSWFLSGDGGTREPFVEPAYKKVDWLPEGDPPAWKAQNPINPTTHAGDNLDTTWAAYDRGLPVDAGSESSQSWYFDPGANEFNTEIVYYPRMPQSEPSNQWFAYNWDLDSAGSLGRATKGPYYHWTFYPYYTQYPEDGTRAKTQKTAPLDADLVATGDQTFAAYQRPVSNDFRVANYVTQNNYSARPNFANAQADSIPPPMQWYDPVVV